MVKTFCAKQGALTGGAQGGAPGSAKAVEQVAPFLGRQSVASFPLLPDCPLTHLNSTGEERRCRSVTAYRHAGSLLSTSKSEGPN